MEKTLVIVESPAKAKTINKYLGKNYVVKSSVGHIRDLPQSGQQKGPAARRKPLSKDLSPQKREEEQRKRAYEVMVRQMGLDPANGWQACYVIMPNKEKVLAELKKASEKVGDIFLATDLDREGEAIAWHLKELIGGDESRFKRVTFSEITKKAIQEAFQSPGSINVDRVHAQQTRRYLDRVVGFLLSPLLWKKLARGLSAGRVQSVAVRLIIEREREIHAFVPEEYWEAEAAVQKMRGSEIFKAKVVKFRDKTFRPTGSKEAAAADAALRQSRYLVDSVEEKPNRKKPLAPFITSTLQQTASLRLGFSVKKTMMLAQRLYEAGIITYMRTDSTNLSSDAQKQCRDFIRQKYGIDYLPATPLAYKNKKQAQEAHEAIRPSDVNMNPGDLVERERDEQRLYDLIWRRFVACQMNSAVYNTSTVNIKAGEFLLRAKGRVMKFDGWLRVMPLTSDEDVILPEVKAGEELNLVDLTVTQHFTKPPARYNEASLVKELEKRSIGRPSTYASIISTIQNRGYVRLESKRFYAEKMGAVVTDRLTSHFNDLLDYNFTAQMEEELDQIAQGERDWRHSLDTFYAKLLEDLDKANATMLENNPTTTDIACPKCARPMMIRIGRTGVFLGCSGYNLPPKARCKSTLNLVRGDEIEEITDISENSNFTLRELSDNEPEEGENGNNQEQESAISLAEVSALLAKRRCLKCATAMDSFLIDENRKLHICGNNPDCDGFFVEKGKFRIRGYDGPIIQCDKCGHNMELKTGRFGKFFGCTNYPSCTNTRKLMRNGEAAPPRMDPVPMPEVKCEKSDGFFILRDGNAGLFLASNMFPKSRETRSPLVEDLVRHRSELDPKYHYLADGPARDEEGNQTIIRFKRKEGIMYLSSEKDGKATGWTAFYEEGRWVVRPAETKTAARSPKSS